MSTAAQHTLKITKDTLRKVTVFNDRAELRREFTVDLVEGTNEVAIQAISKHTNDDSVRVTGRGAAVIEEVQVAQRRVARGAVDSERAAEIRREKEELELAREKVDCDSGIVQKQSTALDAMVAQIGAPPKDGVQFATNATTLESITNLFGYHRKQVAQLREEYRALRKEFDRLTSLITIKDMELKEITHGDMSKNVIVLLEASEAGTVTLDVTYQVGKAGWSPLYDIRVDTKESKTDMQLSYYANVHQNTGEEWEGAQLTLSTARPCVGGNLPELKTLDVSLYRPPVVYSSFGTPASHTSGGTMFGSSTGAAFGAVAATTSTSSTTLFGAAPAGAAAFSFAEQPVMQERHAAPSEQTLSTEFNISRPCSIPADGAQHKVTIGIVFLTPQLVHESVPSMNASAFLTATALNSSQLPLLAGNASVYLDGAFVARTALKSVSPGERFTASLGVDPAVKIEYKPAHKYHEQTGLISKWSCTVKEQKIVVKNTRNDSVLLTISEQIPRSTDEKIKVTIISPEKVEKVAEVNEEERNKVGARLLPSNNLEWTMKMDKGATQNLLVKYTVEHPSNEKLVFNTIFG